MPKALPPGIYEQVINRALKLLISNYDTKKILTEAIDPAEAPETLAGYFSHTLEQVLSNICDSGGSVSDQILFLNKIVAFISEQSKDSYFSTLAVEEGASVLKAVFGTQANEYGFLPNTRVHPETSSASSSLFTGAPDEPQLFSELRLEIASCNSIDMLVSFIKWSGLRLIIEELRAFTNNGGSLRVITTSYMGATDIKAIEELNKLKNTKIKISYDTKRTRLHAKSYIFNRLTGFGAAYVGSSNLSNAAISSGLEWNIKIAQDNDRASFEKIRATFESYWNSADFEEFSANEHEQLARALNAERHAGADSACQWQFDITPYPYQREILDTLDAERVVRGRFKNLVVAATGTGKTIISAFDYKNYCTKTKGRPRLLFVAHREEILKQSRDAFRGVLRDPNFGELMVGNFQAAGFDHLFVSVQSMNAKELYTSIPTDFYDFIIVDEFHHAAAPSYKKLLEYFKPHILLGLTATPERMDGGDILQYFDGSAAAEIRLPEAINRKLLSPFQYFGITDEIDLSSIRWQRGGYDRRALSDIYTLSGAAAKRRAEMIFNALQKYVTDMNEVKALGFCVSVEHARFMAEIFNLLGLPSAAVTGETENTERCSIKERLVSGSLRYIFAVDIYNEGVDIPEINTILLLRPTESLTVFLQQLGRGLRLSDGKECLTVLDFIGQANSNYNFESKFTALLARTERGIVHEIKHGFMSLPKGCYIRLEKLAQGYILNNIRRMVGQKNAIIARLASFEEESGTGLTLHNFLTYYHLTAEQFYKRDSFSRLCVAAGVLADFNEPAESFLKNALPRLALINSRRWIKFLLEWIKEGFTVDGNISEENLLFVRMFCQTVWLFVPEVPWDAATAEKLASMRKSPVMCTELRALLEHLFTTINFVDENIQLGYTSTLDLYCDYSKDQLLTAIGHLNPANVREGVKWLPEINTEVLFVTLNKSEKDYSPTTMYKDYSVSDIMFHWQSQSTTAEESSAGQRYINQKQNGTKILLFVRETKKNSCGNTTPYTFLGPVNYLKHEGSRPMNVSWHLERTIPARFLKKTNRLAV